MDSPDAARLFARLDRELWIVTAADGARRSGLVATFVSTASIVPELPRVVIGVARQHFTWELIEASGAFALHLVSEDQLEWVWRFGLRSGREFDKFENLSLGNGPAGSPILTEALGWLDCRVETRLETGDRTVYLAEVIAGRLECDEPPLTMHRLLEVAPRERLTELKSQLQHDAAIDRHAIEMWRQPP